MLYFWVAPEPAPELGPELAPELVYDCTCSWEYLQFRPILEFRKSTQGGWVSMFFKIVFREPVYISSIKNMDSDGCIWGHFLGECEYCVLRLLKLLNGLFSAYIEHASDNVIDLIQIFL